MIAKELKKKGLKKSFVAGEFLTNGH